MEKNFVLTEAQLFNFMELTKKTGANLSSAEKGFKSLGLAMGNTYLRNIIDELNKLKK